METFNLANIPSIDELTKKATDVFIKQFGYTPDAAAFAPGRVNIIGEHTDYNFGFVFPMALQLGTVVVGKNTNQNAFRILTTASRADDPKYTTFPKPAQEKPYDINERPKWANYVKGVVANFQGNINTFDAVYVSSVPLGSGVSSSASLQVATYILLEQLNGGSNPKISIKEKVLACEDAEHEYAGLPCGIMDQYISMTGKEGHVHLIDCRSLENKLIPFEDPSVTVLLTNSNVHHELTGTPYAERQYQCEMAAKQMNKTSLREVTEEDVKCHKHNLDVQTLKRVRHVMDENIRTLEAAKSLEEKNYERLGKLMIESHNSLRDNFEVSCVELDQLVSSAIESEGVYGSRLTGGGFGGCTVTLLKTSAIQSTVKHITEKYTGSPTFYVCSPSSGARDIQIP